MKTNNLFFGSIILLLLGSNVMAQNSAGKWFADGENQGKTFVIGSDKAMELVLESVDAYNARDTEKEMGYYSERMKERQYEFSENWHNSMASLNMNPVMMVPLKLEGEDKTRVFSISIEEREWKNGSKQKLALMEIFMVDDKTNKIDGFNQFQYHFPENEFGLNAGGKFFGKKDNPNTGKKLVFSNRGETESIEKLVDAYNQMDLATCKTFFSEDAIINAADGTKIKLNDEVWESLFSPYSSVEWKLYSIAPMKIYDTDPESGATVLSKEKRVLKSGEVWEKELVEMFYFNLEGKINYVVQYEKEL